MLATQPNYQIITESNCLICDTKGLFNVDFINQCASEINQQAEILDDSWGQITILRNDSLFVPEALEALNLSTSRLKNKGLKLMAIVLSNANSNILIKRQLSGLYQNANLPVAFFETLFDAKFWLNQQLNNEVKELDYCI